MRNLAERIISGKVSKKPVKLYFAFFVVILLNGYDFFNQTYDWQRYTNVASASAAENLAKLSSFLKAYPKRTLMIEGHTDNVGSEESNLSLSQRRAESVRSYLLEQGISNSRLSAYGKGENSPVTSNDSISGRALNRRVEVIIANPAAAQ